MILYVIEDFFVFIQTRLRFEYGRDQLSTRSVDYLIETKKILSSLKSQIEYLVLKGNQLAMKTNTYEFCIPVIKILNKRINKPRSEKNSCNFHPNYYININSIGI